MEQIIKEPIEDNYAGGYRLEYDGKYITLFGRDKNYKVWMLSDDAPEEYEEMVLVSCVAEVRNARPEIIEVDDEFIHIALNLKLPASS